jgi:hypothetical protein
MRDVIYFFREGGSGMYVILLLAVAAIAVGVAYAISGARPLRPVAAGLLGATLLAGLGFQMRAQHRVEEAVAGIEGGPGKAELMAMGQKEAGRNLQLALGGIFVGAIAFIAGELKRRKIEG